VRGSPEKLSDAGGHGGDSQYSMQVVAESIETDTECRQSMQTTVFTMTS
jgi:hypothetical protein